MRWKKDNLQIFTVKKNGLLQLLFLEIVSVTKNKNKLAFAQLYISISLCYYFKMYLVKFSSIFVSSLYNLIRINILEHWLKYPALPVKLKRKSNIKIIFQEKKIRFLIFQPSFPLNNFSHMVKPFDQLQLTIIYTSLW